MALPLKTLCTENDNQFKLSLQAGGNGFRNAVTWVHMIEDPCIIPYFHGSELAVTTCIKAASDPLWLYDLVRELKGRGAAGLVVNTGKYIFDIPQEVLRYCEEQEFPLLTMPWEIHVTEMLQTFCTRIIQERSESVLFDKALGDALFKRGSEEEYREILSRYYDLNGKFTVILIHISRIDENIEKMQGIEYAFINRLRRFKTINEMTSSKFGLLNHDNSQLIVANNVDRSQMPGLLKIILDIYEDAAKAHALFVGVGIEVTGLSNINKSFNRAHTAMRMAVYRNVPYIHFEDMGFYKILFSVKDEDILSAYADEILAPIEGDDAKRQGYIELLQAYIQNDRSLERTAAALYLHRNTVNYRIQKMKMLLDSPLKTVEDLFPFQVALAIRDMDIHSYGKQEDGAARKATDLRYQG